MSQRDHYCSSHTKNKAVDTFNGFFLVLIIGFIFYNDI